MEKYQSDSAILPFSRSRSIEVISEEEITTISDTEIMSERQKPIQRQKKRKIVKNAMSGFILRHDLKEGDDFITWKRYHVVTSDGILVFSEAENFLIESRISLDAATVREVRIRGQGALFLQTKGDLKMLLRFRNRSDRGHWLRSLKFQSTLQTLNRQVDFTPNKRRQIFFIDGTEEFQLQVETMRGRVTSESDPTVTSSDCEKTGQKRKGKFVHNLKSKILKMSEFVNCFGNLRCD